MRRRPHYSLDTPRLLASGAVRPLERSRESGCEPEAWDGPDQLTPGRLVALVAVGAALWLLAVTALDWALSFAAAAM